MSNYKSNLQTNNSALSANNIDLQSLIDQVDDLPEFENLNDEIGEQDNLITQIASALESKATNSGSTSTDTDLDTITLVNNTGSGIYCGAIYLDNGESTALTFKPDNTNTIMMPIQAKKNLSNVSCTTTNGVIAMTLCNRVRLNTNDAAASIDAFIVIPYIMNLTSGSIITITA